MQNKKAIGIVAAIISSGTFGLIPLFSIPLMREGMSETSVLFYRCLFSALAIALLCITTGKKTPAGEGGHSRDTSLRQSRGTILRLGAMGLVYCTTAIALLLSYRYIASGVVTTIHFLYPIIVAVLMTVIYKEKCSVRLFLAAVVTMIGVASLSWTGSGFMSATGLILALSTAVSYAVYIVGLNQKRFRDLDGRVAMLYILSFSAIIFGVVSLLGGGISPIPGGTGWFNLVMLALLPTIVSNITLLKAVKYAGATTTSILGSAEPMVAVIFGVSVFSESLTTGGVIGLVIIITAVTYVIVSGSRSGKLACQH